ncbi:hypothetical protein Tco_0222819 [Tanacetum coccineum]
MASQISFGIIHSMKSSHMVRSEMASRGIFSSFLSYSTTWILAAVLVKGNAHLHMPILSDSTSLIGIGCLIFEIAVGIRNVSPNGVFGNEVYGGDSEVFGVNLSSDEFRLCTSDEWRFINGGGPLKRIFTKGRKTKPKTTKLGTEWNSVKRRSQIEAKKSTKSKSQQESQTVKVKVNPDKVKVKRKSKSEEI